MQLATARYSQPRGRPKKDHHWCTRTGRWIPDHHHQTISRVVHAHVPQPVHWSPGVFGGAQCDAQRRFEMESAQRRFETEQQLRREKEKRDEQARAAAFERESARLAAEAAAKQAADARAAKEKERLEAPQRYAASLYGTEGARVYYFDTNNEFQELGKERKRVVKDESVPMKRVRRVVDRWVYGPNPKYQLEAGESELVTKAVWVSVPMW